MKKRSALFVSLIMVFMLCFSQVVMAKEYVDAKWDTQQESIDEYTKIMEAYSEAVVSKNRATSTIVNCYGGGYINEQAELVVLLTEMSDNVKETFRKVVDNPNLLFEKVDYTYKEQYSEYQSIVAYFSSKERGDLSEEFIMLNSIFEGVARNDSQNKVKVYLSDVSDENVKLFQKLVSDKEYLEFVEIGKIEEEATLKPGCKLTKGTGAGASMGYRARYQENGIYYYGFVTAGHFVLEGATVYYNNNAIGTCTMSSQYMMDAAFVEVNTSQHSLSNSINGTSRTHSSVMVNPVEGAIICKSGHHGVSSGIVKDIDVYFSDMNAHVIGVDYASDDGDSGAIVYTNQNTAGVVGIHYGRYGNANFEYAAVIPATTIYNMWGVQPY